MPKGLPGVGLDVDSMTYFILRSCFDLGQNQYSTIVVGFESYLWFRRIERPSGDWQYKPQTRLLPMNYESNRDVNGRGKEVLKEV